MNEPPPPSAGSKKGATLLLLLTPKVTTNLNLNSQGRDSDGRRLYFRSDVTRFCRKTKQLKLRKDYTASEEEEEEEKTENARTVLCHLNGVYSCVFGAAAAAVGALWQCVGGTAAPGAICGAHAGGRVSPGANQTGHTGCGHWGRNRHEHNVRDRSQLSGSVIKSCISMETAQSWLRASVTLHSDMSAV